MKTVIPHRRPTGRKDSRGREIFYGQEVRVATEDGSEPGIVIGIREPDRVVVGYTGSIDGRLRQHSHGPCPSDEVTIVSE